MEDLFGRAQADREEGEESAEVKEVLLPCFAEFLYKVVLQKSIPAQICQLIFYMNHDKDKLTDLWGT